MNPSKDTKLQIVREIGAPRDRVYAAWTDSTLAEQGWGPDGGTTHELITDAHLGGKFRWVLSIPEEEEITVESVYREVQPGKKLALTWSGTHEASKDPAESLVRVELRKIDAATTGLHLTHENLPSEESRDNHSLGWNSALDRLQQLCDHTQLTCKDECPIFRQMLLRSDPLPMHSGTRGHAEMPLPRLPAGGQGNARRRRAGYSGMFQIHPLHPATPVHAE